MCEDGEVDDRRIAFTQAVRESLTGLDVSPERVVKIVGRAARRVMRRRTLISKCSAAILGVIPSRMRVRVSPISLLGENGNGWQATEGKTRVKFAIKPDVIIVVAIEKRP